MIKKSNKVLSLIDINSALYRLNVPLPHPYFYTKSACFNPSTCLCTLEDIFQKNLYQNYCASKELRENSMLRCYRKGLL